jgi:hypothetical protein
MKIQQIQIPLASILKAIKRKEQFVLGVVAFEESSALLPTIWHEVISELSKTLGAELQTTVNRVGIDEIKACEESPTRSGRFHSLGAVLQWRKHRLTIVEFQETSKQGLLRFGPQCDGVVAIVENPDRDAQKSIRALSEAGVHVMGYWPITSLCLQRGAA